MKYIDISRHSFCQNTSVYAKYQRWFGGHFVNGIFDGEDFFVTDIICKKFRKCTVNSWMIFSTCRIDCIRNQICTVIFEKIQHIFLGGNSIQHCNLAMLCQKNIVQHIIRISTKNISYFCNRFSCIRCIFRSMECAGVNTLKSCQFHNVFKNIRRLFQHNSYIFSTLRICESAANDVCTAFLKFWRKKMYHLSGASQIWIQVKINFYTSFSSFIE